ncbi:MAG: pilus assembly protein [Ktedonobacterales bacterium]|nr:pilus assembly protein [Ktedonobacterales bacterium]
MRRAAHRGQSLVEFALFVSVLLTLLAGLLNLGAFLNAHLSITYAARQGALSAATAGNAPLADCDALAAIAIILRPSNDVGVTHIIIYQAASDGLPIGGLGSTAFANVYDGDPGCSDSLNPPVPTVTNWPTTARNATLYQTTMLGVEIDYTYSWQNALFPIPPFDVKDRAIMPLGTG